MYIYINTYIYIYITNLLHHEQVCLMFNERYSSLWRKTSSVIGPE